MASAWRRGQNGSIDIWALYWTVCRYSHVQMIDLPIKAVRKLGEEDRCDCSGYLVMRARVSMTSRMILQGSAYVWGCTHQLSLPAAETHSSRRGWKVKLSACGLGQSFQGEARIHRGRCRSRHAMRGSPSVDPDAPETKDKSVDLP
jgi:hypothetical protein